MKPCCALTSVFLLCSLSAVCSCGGDGKTSEGESKKAGE